MSTLTPMVICREAVLLLSDLSPSAEMVTRKGPRTEPWTIKSVYVDTSPEALAMTMDEYRERELQPAITLLRSSLPNKLRVLKFGEPNPGAGDVYQIEYMNLSVRFKIIQQPDTFKDTGEISIIVDGTV